jgi:hypothetical protein
MRMRTLLAGLAVGAAMVVGASGTAHAASPHYVQGPTASINTSTGAIQVSFKAAGLGSNQSIDYSLNTGPWSLTLGCLNKGGNEPQGLETYTASGASSSGTLTSGKNGQITATVSAGGASGLGFTCPSKKMSVVLVSASYSNVSFYFEAIGTRSFGTVSYSR